MGAGNRLVLKRPLRPFIWLVGISAVISTLLSVSPEIAAPRLLLYASMILVGVTVYAWQRDDMPTAAQRYCLVLAAIQMPLIAVVVWKMVESHGTLLESRSGVPNFANVRHFGHICFLAAVCGLGTMRLSSEFSAAKFVLTSFALFGGMMVGSRGPTLAWLACAILVCSAIRWGRVQFAWQAGSVAAGASFAVWILDVTRILPSPNVFSRIGKLSRGTQSLDSGRLENWSSSLHAYLHHPWFGLGPEGYELSGCCDRLVSHPHNFPLQFLMEFGLIGCGLTAALLIAAAVQYGGFRRLAACIRLSADARVLFAILASIALLGLIDGVFYYAVPLLYVAVLAGLLAACVSRSATESPRRSEHRRVLAS
jgi:O-antigen ligase